MLAKGLEGESAKELAGHNAEEVNEHGNTVCDPVGCGGRFCAGGRWYAVRLVCFLLRKCAKSDQQSHNVQKGHMQGTGSFALHGLNSHQGSSKHSLGARGSAAGRGTRDITCGCMEATGCGGGGGGGSAVMGGLGGAGGESAVMGGQGTGKVAPDADRLAASLLFTRAASTICFSSGKEVKKSGGMACGRSMHSTTTKASLMVRFLFRRLEPRPTADMPAYWPSMTRPCLAQTPIQPTWAKKADNSALSMSSS